jgi:5'-nucleotidase
LEDGAGRFAQVAGLKYAFDRSKPAGSRVSDVQVMDGGAWKPIDEAKDYIVATNNYVRQGGDGYKIFADKAKDAYDYGPGLEQVVADYLGKNNPYTPKIEGRITEVGAATAPAQEPAKPAEAAAAGPAEPAETAKPAEPTPAAPEKPAQAAPSVPDLPAGSSDIANSPPSVPTETAPAPAPAETAKPAETAPAEPAKPAETTPAQPAQPAAPAPGAEANHVIARGDTYWDLAVKYYGDGAMWHKIADANPGHEPRRLPVGATLKIPAK